MAENVQIADDINSSITLNDGVEMPMFGLGVWLARGESASNAVSHALKSGYKMIDTAQYYENETEVGKGIKISGIDRKDVFIVTKVWYTNHGREDCLRSFNDSLKKLDTNYVDLYLIHAPLGGKVLETYDTILELKKQGKIRSVGVSNFGIQHFEALEKAGRPLPSVNQIELHLWQKKQDLVKYCREKGIAVMGYSPLAKGKRLEDPKINEMAAKYGKNIGQLMIKYSVQMGYITIPKSQNLERIISNADAFTWKINNEDMNYIMNLKEWSCTWDPTKESWVN